MSLDVLIREQILAKGPMSIASYMDLALQHPEFGYYRQHDPLGASGDFITAPEVSQMFGEMIGLWCADIWQQMAMPSAVTLLEMGPGRGTLMQDALRATAKIKGFHDAMDLQLLETNASLCKQQQERLLAYLPVHIDNLAQLPPQPLIAVANEFFDALPIRQFEKTGDGWCERLVGVHNGELAMTLSPPTQDFLMLLPEAVREAVVGTVHEISLPSLAILRQIAKHIAHHGGGFLVIDYGYNEVSGLASLQAVLRHAPVTIFERPGEVDLTAHVDFGALRMVAGGQNIKVTGPVGQGVFLQAMGIELRATQLKLRADIEQAKAIDTALARLTDIEQMGQLFKVMAITSPTIQPAGFL
jgi:SAM-dependent MidA family methyltransferase